MSKIHRFFIKVVFLVFFFSFSLLQVHSVSTQVVSLDELAGQADVLFGPIDPLFDDFSRWEERKAELRDTISYYLGEPTVSAVFPEILVEKQEEFTNYTRKKISVHVSEKEWIPAYLLIPKGFPFPRPALLALHQTVPQGKEEPVGITGKQSMFYGLELVIRGYVVLSMDEITAGERLAAGETPFSTASFDSENPDWSAMGKMLWDHSRMIDYLETLDIVDRNKIGVIGHSLGGYNALFLGAFDDRIKAVVASSAYTRIETDPGRERWSRSTGFIHFPRLRPFIQSGYEGDLPWDFQHVLALIAPKPLFQVFGLKDDIFPNTSTVAQIHKVVLPIYQNLEASDDLVTHIFDGPHDFLEEFREQAYDFLDTRLLETDPFPIPRAVQGSGGGCFLDSARSVITVN